MRNSRQEPEQLAAGAWCGRGGVASGDQASACLSKHWRLAARSPALLNSVSAVQVASCLSRTCLSLPPSFPGVSLVQARSTAADCRRSPCVPWLPRGAHTPRTDERSRSSSPSVKIHLWSDSGGGWRSSQRMTVPQLRKKPNAPPICNTAIGR